MKVSRRDGTWKGGAASILSLGEDDRGVGRWSDDVWRGRRVMFEEENFEKKVVDFRVRV